MKKEVMKVYRVTVPKWEIELSAESEAEAIEDAMYEYDQNHMFIEGSSCTVKEIK